MNFYFFEGRERGALGGGQGVGGEHSLKISTPLFLLFESKGVLKNKI